MVWAEPTGNAPGPLQAVCDLAEASAESRGHTLVGHGLRLFESREPAPLSYELADELRSPFALGRLYELSMVPANRRRSATHLTPEATARSLVALLPEIGERVLDPSVGGGAFLIAAADALVQAGTEPRRARDRLSGRDVDAGAIAVAEAALAIWALDRGIAPEPIAGLQVGDGLLDPLPRADVIVGNPPFLTQLRSASSHTASRRAALRQRWGELVGAYTDDAWLFLAASVDALEPDGALIMLQPVSILAAQHAGAVRSYLAHHLELTDLWVGRDRIFDAVVQVCALGAIKSQTADRTRPVRRWAGAAFEPCPPTATQPAPDRWGEAASIALDVPSVKLDRQRVVGELAHATAGFRDEFYGLVPFVRDLEHGEAATSLARLVTVGMIDPFHLRWGEQRFSFAKERLLRPAVDMVELRARNRRLGDWVDARRRPKLVLATQTRVLEVWVDELGTTVPATPVLSVEPFDEGDLWLLAAALGAPAVTAEVVAAKFGTAMSLDAVKVAARDVLQIPLPPFTSPWHEAAEVVQALHRSAPSGRADRDEALRYFAALMARAYGHTSTTLMDWWHKRLPNRRTAKTE